VGAGAFRGLTFILPIFTLTSFTLTTFTLTTFILYAIASATIVAFAANTTAHVIRQTSLVHIGKGICRLCFKNRYDISDKQRPACYTSTYYYRWLCLSV
jgi:hypothetical protein